MAEADRQKDAIPPEILDVIRMFVTSLRSTRLYPVTNPIYLRAVQNAFTALGRQLQVLPDFVINVLKTDFAYGNLPAARDTQLFRSIAGDLFAKGIRQIAFKSGLTADELRRFLALLAIPGDELKEKSSIKSLIWEEGMPHITVTEAELDEVVHQESNEPAAGAERSGAHMTLEELKRRLADKALDLLGRRVMITDTVADPASFGAMMIEMAAQSGSSPAQRETRLFDLYCDAGRQILRTSHDERRPLFDALAESVLSMEPGPREGLISRKLYHELDTETVRENQDAVPEQVPDDLHELLSARFSKSWTIPQVSALLEKSSRAQFEPARALPERNRLPDDLHAIAREMTEYTPDELNALKALSDYTREPAVIGSVVRTLIYVLPHVRNPFFAGSDERHLSLFSAVIGELEEYLRLSLEKRDYSLALVILRAFRIPVDTLFRPRIADALKRAGDRKIITLLLENIRSYPKDAPEYREISTYLSLLDREVTPMLLEMLAEEQDRSLRNLLIRILKELGKTQLALLGEKLSDERWYFVRNIITILGENRKEEVVGYLGMVAGHPNFHIRQEVVRVLMTIKGERAADLLIRFLKDRDVDIRFMAVRGLGMSSGPGKKEEQALIEFLKGGRLQKATSELQLEAIASLGKVGGKQAREFLAGFVKIRWWKSRKIQETIKGAAVKAIAEIERRAGDAGRS